MTDDLVAFLRARLDEDEQTARACFSRLQKEQGRWIEDFSAGMQVRDDAGNLVVKHSWPNEIAHIARHDPARVLAEVAAKRRIIAEHSPVDPCDAHDASLRSIPCDTLRLLALPYAGRPGFQAEWAPDEEATK